MAGGVKGFRKAPFTLGCNLDFLLNSAMILSDTILSQARDRSKV
jgi:hypothetical protein